MNRGYFVVASNTDDCDYVRLAYGLALSIKHTQTNYANLSIAVNKIDDVPEKWRWAFDHIIEIPWNDTEKAHTLKGAAFPILSDVEYNKFCEFIDNEFIVDRFNSTPWKFRHEAKVYELSPYDETIKLEADMLLMSDISYWWDSFSKYDIQIANTVVDYKGDIANTDHYRKCFIENNLYSAHSCMTYFKKSEEAKQFFDLVTDIFYDWEYYSWHMLRYEHQPEPTTDVVYGMAVILLNKEFEYKPKNDLHTFAHMRSRAMPWKRRYSVNDNWTEVVKHHFTPELELYVHNYKQIKPFHYHVKDFLTDDIIAYYEAKLKC